MPRQPVVYSVGEALWDLFAPRGESLSSARDLRLEPGGAAVIVALTLAREGISVGLATAVGADPLGRALRDRVAASGIDVRAVEEARARTGLIFIGRQKGERQAVGYRRAAEETFVSPPPSARPKVVHFASLVPVLAVARGQRAAARAFAARGAIVTLDLNIRPRIWKDAAGRAAESLKLTKVADIVKCSDEDLASLGWREGAPGVAAIRSHMRPESTLLVTRGGGPVTAHGPFGVIRHVGRPLRDVDATGAGDAFMAGVIAEILQGSKRGELGAPIFQRAIVRGAAQAKQWIRR